MKYTSAKAVSQLLGLGGCRTDSKNYSTLVKAKDFNLYYVSVSLKAAQKNLKPSFEVGLFAKAGAWREHLVSVFVFQHFIDQICFQRVSHLEITLQLNFIFLPPSAGPTGQFKISPHTNR